MRLTLLAGCLLSIPFAAPGTTQEPVPPPPPPPRSEPAPVTPTPAPQQPAGRPAQAAPAQGQEPQGQAPRPQEPQGQGQGQEPAPGEGRGRRGRGRRGRGGQGPGGDGEAGPGGQAQGPDGAPGEGEEGDPTANAPAREPRRGIPVDDPFVIAQCVRCHQKDEKGLMTRISYVRKSPEGWSETLKRMIRLHGLQVSPAEAKQLVRYLANAHGLTRSEAERSLYESERRVHWSEEHEDDDFKQACAACHTLGRVLMQARDREEWQLLRATHVAMFPLARGQMGGGPPPEPEERGFPQQGGNQGAQGRRGARGGATGGATGGARGGNAPTGGDGGGGGRQGQQGDRGDRVLAALADKQPLFTPEWDSWQINRREVPLAGTWTVTGHETGRGDLLGTAVITRVEADEFEVRWSFDFGNGDHVERTGRGLLYGGYSWRGRTTDPGAGGRTWREVLLLDERWEAMRGRFFTGDHDETGVDVQLQRHRGLPRVLAVAAPWVTVPAENHSLDVHGENFPLNVAAADFTLGRGVTVRRCERLGDDHVRLWIDVAPKTECGQRQVGYGSEPARVEFTLYDAIDYVRIRPLQGFARIGGERFPKQYERFEAIAVHRGPDGKPYTDDDVDLMMVTPKWSLRESPVRDDDDDLQYVGAIDEATGLFTPNVDGPNMQRKWSANNTGEVYVECAVDLDVPVRPPEPTPPPAPAKPAGDDKPAGEGGEHGHEPGEGAPPAGEGAEGHAGGQEPQPQQPPPPANAPQPAAPTPAAPTPQEPAATSGTPTMERRTFRSRANLLVTVPLYIRWTRLEWEDR